MKNDDWIKEIKNAQKIQKYSQTGEEGYIEFILEKILPPRTNGFLVDIGAGDGFRYSNSRYFIEEYNFQSLLIDGDSGGNKEVKQAWITRENVLQILEQNNCPKEFDFLSYDTDGNDFDIIKRICRSYKPDLIVCEINGTIPLGVSKKIKYDPSHYHKGDDYYGFSFSACLKLAELIGYRVVFQNDALNAYLVRKELLANPDAEINVPFVHNPYHPHNKNGIWETV